MTDDLDERENKLTVVLRWSGFLYVNSHEPLVDIPAAVRGRIGEVSSGSDFNKWSVGGRRKHLQADFSIVCGHSGNDKVGMFWNFASGQFNWLLLNMISSRCTVMRRVNTKYVNRSRDESYLRNRYTNWRKIEISWFENGISAFLAVQVA